MFIPEHLSLHPAGVRKIDLERSLLTFIFFGDNFRMENVVVQADPSKELRKTGRGEFSDRPEQQDAEALCRRFPKYVNNPRRLQSGQWIVDFIQLARKQKIHFSAPKQSWHEFIAQTHKGHPGSAQKKALRHHGRRVVQSVGGR